MKRAGQRQEVLAGHLGLAPTAAADHAPPVPPTPPTGHPAPASAASYERRAPFDDDIVIVSACRTPLCKARRGGLKDADVVDLAATVLQETLRRTGVEPEAVGDVCFGSVLGSSFRATKECRMATLLSGFPVAVPVHVVNRQCGSGLQAIAQVAASIRAGFYSVGIAGGVESMSAHPMPRVMHEGPLSRQVAQNRAAQDCLLTMGNVAAEGPKFVC
ncbi:hypothetical protein ABPG75_010872 [Micractinium tetrahymenae]